MRGNPSLIVDRTYTTDDFDNLYLPTMVDTTRWAGQSPT